MMCSESPKGITLKRYNTNTAQRLQLVDISVWNVSGLCQILHKTRLKQKNVNNTLREEEQVNVFP